MSVQATDRTQTAPEAAQGGNVFDRLFLEHPRDVKESYFEHFGHSASYGFRVLSIATCCFIHALIPGLCVRTGSGVVSDLHHRMVTHRNKSACADQASAAPMAADV